MNTRSVLHQAAWRSGLALVLAGTILAGLWGCTGTAGETGPASSPAASSASPSPTAATTAPGFPRWGENNEAHSCSSSDVASMRDRRESEPPVLATEWVNNVDGVIYGEILSVEPVDLFYRYGTGALDMEGLCQDPTWQLSHAVDLKVAPEFAVGLPAHDDVVRIRLGVGILVEWDGAHRYRDGRLVSADGREGLEPGMMVGARIWDLGLHEWAVGQEGPVPDLGLDDGERVYTPLKSSLFYFDDDDRLRFQFSTELSSDWECARPNERFFQREVDDIREGLPRREFEALLSELSPEAFGRYTSTRVEIGRVLPFPWMFEALDPEIRAESGRAFIDYLASYTASACQDPEWQRFPPRDPDAWDEEEDPSEE